ncbi:Oxalate:formate antiporter [Toxocara canis]|uniref:Oxalate:formate antiporter n=1 Tax=Toxocara canis TaxID=6265 RepID=A0A0B2V3M3_TOXCA|nr:Oxalate:formate antiporter [Toxocara canis]
MIAPSSSDVVAVWLMRLNPLARVIIVITGAVLIHLSLGTYHTFGNMLPYMASFMRNYTDSRITLEQLVWIPTFQGCFPFAMIIGGYLNFRLGPRMAAFLGCALMVSGVMLSYWTIRKSLLMFLLTYGCMFGAGQGMAYVIAVTCAINWAPEHVGLVSGIVAAGFGISSSIFAPIQTFLINPWNYKPNRDGYFLEKDLMERVPCVFLSLAFVYAVMQAIGLIVICDPPDSGLCPYRSGGRVKSNYYANCHGGRIECSGCENGIICSACNKQFHCVSHTLYEMGDPHRHESAALRKQISGTADAWWIVFNGRHHVAQWSHFGRYAYSRLPLVIEDAHQTYTATSNVVFDAPGCSHHDDMEPLMDEVVEPVEERSMTTSDMLHSSTFYLLFIALFCCSFYGNMYYNLYKTFAETFIDDDMFMAFAFSVASVMNAIARIGWGVLTDKTSFQISLSSATLLATALLITMPITPFGGKWLYFVWMILMFICLAATHALFITASVKCFGTKYKATNYGCLILSTTLSASLLAFGCEHLLSLLGYELSFLITAAFPFTAFIVTSTIQWSPQGSRIT